MLYHLCHDINDAIDRGCLRCFKRYTASGLGWDKKTIIQCAKKGRFDMFNHVLQERRREHPKIPSEIWNYFPSTYELVCATIDHRNPNWNYLLTDCLEECSNPRKIALFKLAIKAGRQDLSGIIYPYLKPRTTPDATYKDMVDFMECAVFSRQIGMVMWVERTFNTSTNTPWPASWRDNGRRLLEKILCKGFRYYDRFSMYLTTFDYVFSTTHVKGAIHDWDMAASMILNYTNSHFSDTSELFRKFWFVGGRENATPGWKTYCIKYSKLDELALIHEECPEWPATFLDDCETGRGTRTWRRMNLKHWALDHGLLQVNVPTREQNTNLQKALAVIEECDIPEGKYLELCNLLMDVHRRGVRA